MITEINSQTNERNTREPTAEELEELSLRPVVVNISSCSPWQMRKVLNQLGLRQVVEDVISASTDQTLKDGWEFATEFRSDDPFVINMGAALGKSEEETRDLISLARTL